MMTKYRDRGMWHRLKSSANAIIKTSPCERSREAVCSVSTGTTFVRISLHAAKLLTLSGTAYRRSTPRSAISEVARVLCGRGTTPQQTHCGRGSSRKSWLAPRYVPSHLAVASTDLG